MPTTSGASGRFVRVGLHPHDSCWRPRVKGLNLVVNSVFNGWRFEDVWLEKQTGALISTSPRLKQSGWPAPFASRDHGRPL
jgi:hypothetical protein